MTMPSHPRIGYWGNYGFQTPFAPLGRWMGPPLPDVVLGSKIEQELEEGTLEFRKGVLFSRNRPRREQLEYVLILMTRDPTILQAMWNYTCWKQEEYEDDPRKQASQSDKSSAGPTSQLDIPW